MAEEIKTDNSLKIVEGQYIFHENKPLYRIVEKEYAEDIFAEISRILGEFSPEVALTVLGKLPDLLDGKIRRMNDYDIILFNSQHTENRKLVLGEKHICINCYRKSYDMAGRVTVCPLCSTPFAGLGHSSK